MAEPVMVMKEWGHEEWIHNDSKYCGKLLVFEKKNNRFSMHFHMKKHETWYVEEGSFVFNRILVNQKNGGMATSILYPGAVVEIPPGLPHQLIALKDQSIIFEVSTEHFEDDSYRIFRESPDELLS